MSTTNEPEFADVAARPDSTAAYGDEFAAQVAGLDSELSAEERDAVMALPAGSAILIARRGPDQGSRFLLDSAVATAGRHPDADIFLDDVTVSRRHASFVRQDAGFVLRDLGSLNGTYLNGERADESPISDGDEVQVGKYRLTFFSSRAAQGAGS